MTNIKQGLTLITPSGGRPEAALLCQRWMRHQQYEGPVRWIVVDDGEESEPWNFERDGWKFEQIRRRPFWREGQNTQSANFLAALAVVNDSEWIVCIENDDYYAPGWLDRVASELETADLIGQGWNCYYHVKTGAIRENENSTHASLCATAFKGAQNIGLFRRQCERGPRLLDVPMWKHGSNKRVFKDRLVIGMKGMPGRSGIAGGHHMTTDEPFDLTEWIGDDAAEFAQFR